MKHHLNPCRLLLPLLLLALTATLTACGSDDEPKGNTIDDYLEVEEEFLVDGMVDHTDRYYSPIVLMKEAIRTAYPKPDATGKDDAVILACDNLYQRYLQMYTGKAEHLTCLVHLVRTTMNGDIVKQSERLKTYNFDINPPESEIDE